MDGRIRKLMDEMTLEEKASLCSGHDHWRLKSIDRLGIPSVRVSDGPHGLRKHVAGGEDTDVSDSIPSTCFPTASALACSWDTELMREIGDALGAECLRENVSVLLGPGINIKRSPLCGRNFEYFSEDPHLTGEMAAAFIRGVQDKGVGTSIKHFAANNQETLRHSIDALVDGRALREIYLAGFERAIKQAKPWTVMCAYNRLNGAYCCEHTQLLTEILRDEWDYQGLTVSDWWAVHDRVGGLRAGLDLEMPANTGDDAKIAAAVRGGFLDPAILDRAVVRILSLIIKSREKIQSYRYDSDAHHALARKAAAQSAVLLKNEDRILPLSQDARIALIGVFAKEPRYQGSGSSRVHPTRIDSAYDAFAMRDMDIAYAPGYAMESGKPDTVLMQEAVSRAKDADVAVIFAGLPDAYESEGYDRAHMDMPESHNDLITAVAQANPNTVVVLQNGAPVSMPWIGKVKAVLECYLGGQAGGLGAADILTGDVNPSGKLAETFPMALDDTPCRRWFPEGPKTVEYRESVFVGYRYYEAARKEVLFPFGHGLSYTDFAYLDMTLSTHRMADDDTLDVRVTIGNTGDRAGAEILELYVGDVDSAIFRPEKELKGFTKVFLMPGERRTVTFTLDKRSFAYYHTGIGDWHVQSGDFSVMAGSSSACIRLTDTVYVESTRPDIAVPDYRTCAPAYYRLSDQNWDVPARDFRSINDQV